MPFASKEKRREWNEKNREKNAAYLKAWKAQKALADPEYASRKNALAAERRSERRASARVGLRSRPKHGGSLYSLGGRPDYQPKIRRLPQPVGIWSGSLHKVSARINGALQWHQMDSAGLIAANVARSLRLISRSLVRPGVARREPAGDWETAAQRCVQSLCGAVKREMQSAWDEKCSAIAKSISTRRKRDARGG